MGFGKLNGPNSVCDVFETDASCYRLQHSLHAPGSHSGVDGNLRYETPLNIYDFLEIDPERCQTWAVAEKMFDPPDLPESSQQHNPPCASEAGTPEGSSQDETQLMIDHCAWQAWSPRK